MSNQSDGSRAMEIGVIGAGTMGSGVAHLFARGGYGVVLVDINRQILDEALSRRYLAYALSTITARSLPDVRDGLKPVHRRLLYAMRELRLNPESGFKKCARQLGFCTFLEVADI